jgi:T5SS/PEP-CTERM-associated repeat protein/autotransporter-associated beta strand protein
MLPLPILTKTFGKTMWSRSFWVVLMVVFSLVGPTPSVRAAITGLGDIYPENPSSWDSSTYGYVGYSGAGSLTVDTGSDLSSSYAVLGFSNTSTGLVAVTGAGSTWTNTNSVYVGLHGGGTLSITAGAAVGDFYGYIGYYSDATGSITVTGANSTWTNNSEMIVGVYGRGTLSIANGAVVGNTSGYIGYGGSATGAVSVSGAGSTWTNSGEVYVGLSGGGTLSIAGGAAVSNTLGYVGCYSGVTGVVTVSGAGSTWTNSGSLTIGASGGGAATQTGGTVSAAGGLYLGYSSTGNGTYNLNGGVLAIKALGAGSGTAAFNFGGGTLRADAGLSSNLPMTLTGTGGAAVVDTQTYAVALSGVLSGTSIAGGLTKTGSGTLTLAGANTYAGLTVVKAGTLKLVGTSIATPGAWNPAMNLGGADIQAGQLVFDYAINGGPSPGMNVKSILKAGYDGSKFASGRIFSSTCGTTTCGLGWVDNGSAVTVKIAVYGDADLSGVVGASDLSTVLTNFGLAGVWSTGDFDYSGIVGASDLSAVLTNFGQTLPTNLNISPYHLDADAIGILTAAGITAAPEPGTLALSAIGVIGLLGYARRRSKRVGSR